MTEMYRVTRQYRGVGIHTTVTISTRLEARDHSHASEIAENQAKVFILINPDDWVTTKICVQNNEQISSGDFNEIYG